MTRKRATALLLAIALACGGSSTAPATLRVPLEDSPQRGPSDAWVTIVEFGDFQCPYCRAEAPVLARIEDAYGPDVRLVFKHFPLTSLHDRALPAALAAQCAADQGKFWEMHDLLFATALLDDASLLADAGQIAGVDVAAWQSCIAGDAARARVLADLNLGISLGVDATPTLVVNGTTEVGALGDAELSALVERARASAQASGIPRASYYDESVLGR